MHVNSNENMKKYLISSDYIDWETAEIIELAGALAEGVDSQVKLTKLCFEWVRDNIRHSVDYQMNPVTCKASEVLNYGTGYCYAKSHLLAALLRANAIPAGLCYQRLSIDGSGPPYCLHGLNAVYLKEYGWYRVDARGNKSNIDAQFSPPNERLAFAAKLADERDLAEIYHEPLSVVVSVLEVCETYQEVYNNLPDMG